MILKLRKNLAFFLWTLLLKKKNLMPLASIEDFDHVFIFTLI